VFGFFDLGCAKEYLMSDGTVKWFDEKKGFGFISSANGPDIFVHYTNIAGDGFRTLAEGDLVEFDVVKGEKGPKAENVIRKSPAEPAANA
jgi:cold shock protein